MHSTISLGTERLDTLWRHLEYEVTWLHARWTIYRQLFGTSAERVDILNRSAGTFANALQSILLDDVQLGLANLGDPATTGKFQNLTFARLSDELFSAGYLATELPPLLAAYSSACAMIRARRNKRIAHFDLATISTETQRISGPSREEIEEALLAARNFMNRIELHFADSQTAYELIVLHSDGDSLIATLRRGLRYEQLVKGGDIARDDLANSVFGKV